MRNDFGPVLRKIDLILAETAQLASAGPHLRIIHRFWRAGTCCMVGEEVADVCLIHRSKVFSLNLSPRLMVVLDYLSRNRTFAQSTAQIASGMSSDPFCQRHGANARGNRHNRGRVSRTAVKEQITRLRQSLSSVFHDAALELDPLRVLVSEATMTNQVRYRLKASISWQHRAL